MEPVPDAAHAARVDQFITLLTEAQQSCQRGELDSAAQAGERALALARTLGEPTCVASALGTLVGIYGLQHQAPRAMAAGFEGLAVAASIPDVNLCATIHGDIVRVAAPGLNAINREFVALGTSGRLAEACGVAADLRKRVVALGDPMRLASILAAEGQLCGMQGKMADVVAALGRAFDVAIPGGAYETLPQLIGLVNASLRETVLATMTGSGGAGAGAVARRVAEQARIAGAMVASGLAAKIARVRSEYSAANPASNLEPLDALLGEMRSSADRAGLATVTALKAGIVAGREFMGGGASHEAPALYGDAVAHAVASGNARLVWSVAADAEKAIANAREIGGTGAADSADRAEARLRSSLQEFVAALAA